MSDPGNLLGQQALDPVQLGQFSWGGPPPLAAEAFTAQLGMRPSGLCQAPNGVPEISVIDGRKTVRCSGQHTNFGIGKI